MGEAFWQAVGVLASVVLGLVSLGVSIVVSRRALAEARLSRAEAEKIRREQYGYGGGEYCLAYRQEVLGLADKGWSLDQVRRLVHAEDGLRRWNERVAL